MRTLASLLAVAAIAAFGFAGTAQASHKVFSHGGPGSGNNRGALINSVDVTIVCTFSFDNGTGTLTIVSDVADVTGDGDTFDGEINVNVQAYFKADGAGTFTLDGAVLHLGENVPFADSDDFSGLSFGAEDDLTGVVTVTEVDGSLDGRTFFATCDSDEITVI